MDRLLEGWKLQTSVPPRAVLESQASLHLGPIYLL